MKKGRRAFRDLPPFSNRGSANDPHKGGAMVIFVSVKLKDLFKKERNYPWTRPASCPRCNDYKVWGHGYAQAIFDGYNEPLLLKLYRCPVCAALSGFDLVDILNVFRQKLRRSVPAYSIKKNTTNGFQAFPVHDSVTGSEP